MTCWLRQVRYGAAMPRYRGCPELTDDEVGPLLREPYALIDNDRYFPRPGPTCPQQAEAKACAGAGAVGSLEACEPPPKADRYGADKPYAGPAETWSSARYERELPLSGQVRFGRDGRPPWHRPPPPAPKAGLVEVPSATGRLRENRGAARFTRSVAAFEPATRSS